MASTFHEITLGVEALPTSPAQFSYHFCSCLNIRSHPSLPTLNHTIHAYLKKIPSFPPAGLCPCCYEGQSMKCPFPTPCPLIHL